MKNDGINQLARVVEGRMRAHAGKAKEPESELGTIVDGLGLKLDATPDIVIPKSDYMVSRLLTFQLNNPFERTLDVGEEGATIDPQHSHPDAGFAGAHNHNVRLPERLYPIQSGDRVLVIWANRTPVIITVVVKMP